MSSFKGDHHYRTFIDEIEYGPAEEDATVVHELARKPQRVWYHDWLEEHYDVLAELYTSFKSNGRSAFGRPFCDLGGFADFTEYVFKHTVIQPPDLLNTKTRTRHVSAFGSSTGSQHRLSSLQATGHGGPTRIGGDLCRLPSERAHGDGDLAQI